MGSGFLEMLFPQVCMEWGLGLQVVSDCQKTLA